MSIYALVEKQHDQINILFKALCQIQYSYGKSVEELKEIAQSALDQVRPTSTENEITKEEPAA